MAEIIVEAMPREDRGKNSAKRMRRTGNVPAVLYGGRDEAITVSVNAKQLGVILRSESGHNTIFKVKLPNGEHTAIVKDWQVDPVVGSLLHVDLLRIAMDVRMRVKVPVHTFGDPQGVKLQGGIFEMVTREVEIECLPSEIPSEFRVDISGLMLNQQLRAGDLPLDKDKILLLTDPAARTRARGAAARRRREAGGSSRYGSCDSGGARSHQEGQEGRGRRRRRCGRGKAQEVGVFRRRDRQRNQWDGACSSAMACDGPEYAVESAMRLIVGLGNPGMAYTWTPHNMGFLAADRLAERAGIRVERPEAKSLVGLGVIAGSEVVLAKPQTMMNLSGLAVRDLLERRESTPADMIVLYDDVALPWGMLRIRERGTAGGHNGIKSIIGAVGTQEFTRVRMGVQPDHPVGDLATYVLHPMRKAELEIAGEMAEQAAEAVEDILTLGAAHAMNRFNRRDSPPQRNRNIAAGFTEKPPARIEETWKNACTT